MEMYLLVLGCVNMQLGDAPGVPAIHPSAPQACHSWDACSQSVVCRSLDQAFGPTNYLMNDYLGND